MQILVCSWIRQTEFWNRDMSRKQPKPCLFWWMQRIDLYLFTVDTFICSLHIVKLLIFLSPFLVPLEIHKLLRLSFISLNIQSNSRLLVLWQLVNHRIGFYCWLSSQARDCPFSTLHFILIPLSQISGALDWFFTLLFHLNMTLCRVFDDVGFFMELW